MRLVKGPCNFQIAAKFLFNKARIQINNPYFNIS